MMCNNRVLSKLAAVRGIWKELYYVFHVKLLHKRSLMKKVFLFFLSLMGSVAHANTDSFYLGIQGGADFFSVTKRIQSQILNTATFFPTIGAPNFSTETRNSGIGGVGGGFLGYSWQFQDFSFAIEAFGYGDSSSIRKSAAETSLISLNISESDRLRGFIGGLVKPGFLVNEKAKIYGKVGAVNGRFTISGTRTASVSSLFLVNNTTSETDWISGGQIGAGVELFISPCLALNMEYNHIQYKKRTFRFDTPSLNLFGVNQIQRTEVNYRPQSNNALIGLTYYFSPQDTGFSTGGRGNGDYDSI